MKIKTIIKVLLINVVFMSAYLSAEMKVVVNSGYTGSLSEADVKAIFLANNRSLNPIVNTANNADFAKNFLGTSEADFKKVWATLVFTGKASKPKEFASDADVVNHIKTNQAAIGVVSGSADGVKTVLTVK